MDASSDKETTQSRTRVATKRPAEGEPDNELLDEDNSSKRVRTAPNTSSPLDESVSQGARNPIDISYSSSRRWMERQVSNAVACDT